MLQQLDFSTVEEYRRGGLEHAKHEQSIRFSSSSSPPQVIVVDPLLLDDVNIVGLLLQLAFDVQDQQQHSRDLPLD
jgi:hypothetical protein